MCSVERLVLSLSVTRAHTLQVWVVGAQLKEGAIAANASSFVVIDFFDFESQATPLLSGREPRFDFATTYKVSVDDLFLR